jgi:putative transposase
MRLSKFSAEQIAYVLRQAADGMTVGEVCRSAGISPATFYNWRKAYDGLLPTEIRRMKRLAAENDALRKRLAVLTLDKAMLQDVIERKL